MNERDFVVKKQEDWDRLSALVAKANKRGGVRSLSREEILALGPLYRRASSDLAQARNHAVSADLITHLNQLVGQAHALLYAAETSAKPLQAILDFYLYEFPAVLQRRYKSFLAAIAVTIFGGVFSYWLVINHPEHQSLFIPPGFKQSVEAWKSKNVVEESHLEQSGFLMAHNLQVGVMAFAFGILLLPDIYLMFENGAMMGTLSALMTQVHGHGTFWPGILPHGIAELTAIFICGGAGFILAQALLIPMPYSRQDALKIAATDAVKLVLGTIPLFIFAGMIEGMFSHLGIAPGLRYTFAGLNGICWYLYLFLPRKRPLNRAAAARKRNLPASESVIA